MGLQARKRVVREDVRSADVRDGAIDLISVSDATRIFQVGAQRLYADAEAGQVRAYKAPGRLSPLYSLRELAEKYERREAFDRRFPEFNSRSGKLPSRYPRGRKGPYPALRRISGRPLATPSAAWPNAS